MTTLPLIDRPPPSAAPRDLRWVASASCPPDWQEHLERCGGGFFQSPLGLLAGAPAGQPLFAQLQLRGRVVGIAAGVRHGCRFSLKPKHVYFPSLPALVAPELRAEALRELVVMLQHEGAVEVVCDSYDAAALPAPVADGESGRQRVEFQVALAAGAAAQLTHFHPHHVRHLRHAQDAGWTLGMLGGDDARAMLAAVQDSASDRARDLGRGYDVEPPPVANIAAPRLGERWGAAVFVVRSGNTPLAAALVGWANRRAYYISGGSTREGYEARAAFWMHWRIMAALGEAGFASYNLGGTPAEAATPGHPAHGLYQFKWRFGASLRSCCGARWTLQPTHARTHQIVAEIMGAAWGTSQ